MNSPTTTKIRTTMIRHGIAACRGIADVCEDVVFFLIFGEAIQVRTNSQWSSDAGRATDPAATS